MPITTNVRDRGLMNVLTRLQQTQHPTGPKVKIDELTLNDIVREIADGPFASRGGLDKALAGAQTPEAKLKLAQDGLDADEAADVKALLADPGFQDILEPATENFFKAVIGEATLDPSLFRADAANGVGATIVDTDAKAAVAEFKAIAKDPAKLRAYYDAAISDADPLKDEAIKLFDRLPSLHSATGADEYVALGLWSKAPQGIKEMMTAARYIPGRQVIAPAKVNTDLRSGRTFLSYDPSGVDALTYRATLVGEKGDNYLVKIDGKDDPVEVPKAEIHARNQPHLLEGKKLSINGKSADYEDKFMKAKLCEAAIKMEDIVGKIDFRKKRSGGVVGNLISTMLNRNTGGDDVADLQAEAIGVIHDVMDMKYRKGDASLEPDRDGGSKAGRLAVKGWGVCNEQSGVFAALLVPFQDLLGFDMAMMSGGVYRNTDKSGTMQEQYNRFKSPAHSFIQITLRISCKLSVWDRTWRQKNLPADRAYSPGGDRYPSGYSWSMPLAEIEPTDVVMDGSITVETADRQFGGDNDGRQNHMSNAQ